MTVSHPFLLILVLYLLTFIIRYRELGSMDVPDPCADWGYQESHSRSTMIHMLLLQ
jgi:hypothetical protein